MCRAPSSVFVDFLVQVFGDEDRDPWLLAAGRGLRDSDDVPRHQSCHAGPLRLDELRRTQAPRTRCADAGQTFGATAPILQLVFSLGMTRL
jgi:hypothetical protein